MRTPLLLLALAGCPSSTPEPAAGPDPQATRFAAQKLCYVFEYVDIKCRASEDLVEAGEHTLRVAATVQHRVDVARQAAISVRFEFALADEPPGHGVDVLGKGLSASDALDRAAQEWAALVGTAIVDGVRDLGRSDANRAALAMSGRGSKGPGEPAIELDGFRVYPGLSDFRGAAQGGPRVDHASVIGALRSDLQPLSGDSAHSLLLAVQHDGSRFVCEKGRIDGRDSQRVCDVATTVPWPAPVTKYAARQFYLLVPAPAESGEPSGEPPPETPMEPAPTQ